MFGFNIFEILVILIVAIIFLGPDKLPQLVIDIVKFFRVIKRSINDAKETFDKELQISEIKKEALEYKAQFENSIDNVSKDIELQDINTMFKDYKEIEKKEDDTPSIKTEEVSNQEDDQAQENKADDTPKPNNIAQPKIGKKTSFKKKEA